MAEEDLLKERDDIENQLGWFLKRVKQREEHHHALCEHTNCLLARRTQLEQAVFIHDEILQNQARLAESQQLEKDNQEEDETLAVRCDAVLSEEEQSVLGRRIMARVLEVTYAAIEAFRQFREYYSISYIRFKERSLKIVSERVCRPSIAVRLGSRYLNGKIQVEQDRLSQAIACLEMTNYGPFSQLGAAYYEPLLSRKEAPLSLRKEISLPAEERYSPTLLSHRSSSKRQETTQKEEDGNKRETIIRSKIRSTKEEEKIRRKQRRAEVKKMKRFASNIHEVMDVCKEELLEDLAPDNKDWETKRLLGGLVARNKTNRLHINLFLEKETSYQDTISRPPPKSHARSLKQCSSLEEELLMKNDENKVEVLQSSFTSKQIRIESSKRASISIRRRESMRAVPQSGVGKNTQKRATINNIEDFDQKKKDKHVFSSHRQIGHQGQEHIVEINLRGAIKLPKARFPEISARVASVSKQKMQAQKEEPSPLRTKLEIKTNSTYFDEIQKKIVKFCEMKRNLMI